MWPFYKPDFKLKQIAEAMPPGHDIWLLHSPPASFDPGYQLDYAKNGEHAGNPFTTPRIADLKPQLVICGHIHEGFGLTGPHDSSIANVAFIDEKYTVRWRHVEIEWDEGDRLITRVQAAKDDPELGLWWGCR